MRTSLAALALYITKDCDADQAWWVRVWSAIAITVLFWQFGWLALAAVVGSVIGLAILEMASQGARNICRSINEISARSLRDRAESIEISVELSASAARNFLRLMQKAFGAAVALFAALGVAHVALSVRFFPYPLLSRA